MRSVLRRYMVVVVLVATGCGASSAPAGTARDAANVRATIMFVGDSNIALALLPLGFALTQRDDAYQVDDVARAGTAIRSSDCSGERPTCPTDDYWSVRLPEALRRVSPDGLVVNLGINDTSTPGSATGLGYADYGAKIDWLMHLLPASKPVWWTNLPCGIEPTARAAGCAAVNNALKVAPQRWRNLTVVDWAGAADKHPNYLALNLGGIHLTGAGGLAWATLITKALDAHFPA
jgi:GDSL-like Lipase/Acylhydrolase family